MIRLDGKLAALVGGGAAESEIVGDLAQRGASITAFPDIEVFRAHLTAGNAFDIVILKPGYWQQSAFMATTPADWLVALRQNFEDMLFGAQAAARQMIARQIEGRIIFLSGVAGTLALRDNSAVGATLAALHAIARMAAVDLAPYGITDNVIAVGTEADTWIPHGLDEANATLVQAHIPAGRLATVGDAVELCAFLASDGAQYLTGAIIPLDGGYSLTKAGAGTPPNPDQTHR